MFGQKKFWSKKKFLVKIIFLVKKKIGQKFFLDKKKFFLVKYFFGQLPLLVTKLEFLTFFSTDRQTGYRIQDTL